MQGKPLIEVLFPGEGVMAKRVTAGLTKQQLAEALAKALNLLNEVDRDEWSNRQLGDYHELARMLPDELDYANNATVQARDLI